MIVANWKSNGSRESIIDWFKGFNKDYQRIERSSYIGIAPPYVYMDQVKKLCDELEISLALGSQDIDMLSGARTGSISIDMLCDIGGSFSILGHSERRIIFNEKSSSIKQKIIKLEDQAFSILCIGETLEENKSDKAKFIIEKQLEVISNMNLNERFTIAYEPVWAIGTGLTPEPKEINAIHKFIKDVVQSSSANSHCPKVLYGGSVTDKNAKSFFDEEFVDGALVGGASLDGTTFAKIVNIFNG
jgi:triosephosphate isomerase